MFQEVDLLILEKKQKQNNKNKTQSRPKFEKTKNATKKENPNQT